jgi:hypothetical protein
MAKLTPADEKFIAKFLNADGQLDPKVKTRRSNRFSGETVEVDQVCAAAIDFVYKVEEAMHKSEAALQTIHPDLKRSNMVSNFDRARMIVMKLDAKAYMKILD